MVVVVVVVVVVSRALHRRSGLSYPIDLKVGRFKKHNLHLKSLHPPLQTSVGHLLYAERRAPFVGFAHLWRLIQRPSCKEGKREEKGREGKGYAGHING